MASSQPVVNRTEVSGDWEISELRVYSDQTEFILLENLAEEDTNAVVLTVRISFFVR